MTLGQTKEMIGMGMPSEGQIFSQQEMSVAIKKMKENRGAYESGVISEHLRETKRIDEWNIEWSRYPKRVER